MNNTSLDNVQRKDLMTSLALWGVAEFVGFAMFPALQLIRPAGDVMRGWFLTSLPIGLGGVLLIVASSRIVPIINDRTGKNIRTLMAIATGFTGWLALAGILYPLLVVCYEFFTKPMLTNT
jgi:hypothetical protein